jgi:putative glutamine amidotransferase
VPTPLVAIVSYALPPGRVTSWDTGAHALPEPYVGALRRAGARAALLAAPDEGPPEEVLERFDGLVLPGGGDVEPSLYGAGPHPHEYGVSRDRDALEIGLVQAADRLLLPTLAICRGIQVVNVAFGGTLHQHLPDVPGVGTHGAPGSGPPAMHEVKVSESSRLAAACGTTTLTCVSHHHQGIDRLGGGLGPVAWAGDGLIEAVERPEGWLVAVQWHPEGSAEADPAQQALFDAFVERAGDRAA